MQTPNRKYHILCDAFCLEITFSRKTQPWWVFILHQTWTFPFLCCYNGPACIFAWEGQGGVEAGPAIKKV